jgi:hypothetical protein
MWVLERVKSDEGIVTSYEIWEGRYEFREMKGSVRVKWDRRASRVITATEHVAAEESSPENTQRSTFIDTVKLSHLFLHVI